MSNQPPLDTAARGGGAKALDVSASSSSASTSAELPLDWERASDAAELDELDASDERDAQLLANVSALLARMLSCCQRVGADDGDSDNNNGDASEEPAPAPRERLLRAVLAQTLVELSATQTNLQLAASAGKELLEQLGDAKDEASELLDRLHACQQQLESAESENARLRGSPKGVAPTRLGDDERDACRRCPLRSDEMAGALQKSDTLKRRCLELERQLGAQRLAAEELERQHAALRGGCEQLRLGRDAARRDLDDLRSEHAQLRADHGDALAARDNLRLATRRLQAERDALVQKLEARESLVARLEDARRAAATHAQVRENRAARLRADNEALLRALAAAQAHVPRVDCGDSDSSSSLQQHASDLESLLDEAQRSLAALKLENRALRRHQMQQLRQRASRSAAEAAVVTCADVLAADATLRSRTEQEADCARDDERGGEANAPPDAEDDDAPPLLQPPNSPLLRLLAPPRGRRRTLADATCTDKLSLRDQQQRPRRTTVVVGGGGGDAEREAGAAHMDKAPLFLGLSVIACATAAAGLLSRR